jgi:acetoin utilization deacetylase AcuC-like enzyme
VEAVHGKDQVERVRQELPLNPDMPGGKGVFATSLLSAGAAYQAAELALQGKTPFSLMRPPGHHATPEESMGFCYFNSMAITLNRLYKEGKIKRAGVLDLDCHHGNGTEEFCFEKSPYLFISLHQTPCYPGTGLESRGNCRDYPLAPGTKSGTYFTAMEKAMEEIRRFKPDLVGISMGFDTYEQDPLTDFGLVQKDYYAMGQKVTELGFPAFSLLEGGYHRDMPVLIEEYLAGLTE